MSSRQALHNRAAAEAEVEAAAAVAEAPEEEDEEQSSLCWRSSAKLTLSSQRPFHSLAPSTIPAEPNTGTILAGLIPIGLSA